MIKVFTTINLDIIDSLKTRGYMSFNLVLHDPVNSYQATVELIPSKNKAIDLHSILLDSTEAHDYFSNCSPMVNYIIDQVYLLEINFI